jgi:hypothetical protein
VQSCFVRVRQYSYCLFCSVRLEQRRSVVKEKNAKSCSDKDSCFWHDIHVLHPTAVATLFTLWRSTEFSSVSDSRNVSPERTLPLSLNRQRNWLRLVLLFCIFDCTVCCVCWSAVSGNGRVPVAIKTPASPSTAAHWQMQTHYARRIMHTCFITTVRNTPVLRRSLYMKLITQRPIHFFMLVESASAAQFLCYVQAFTVFLSFF